MASSIVYHLPEWAYFFFLGEPMKFWTYRFLWHRVARSQRQLVSQRAHMISAGEGSKGLELRLKQDYTKSKWRNSPVLAQASRVLGQAFRNVRSKTDNTKTNTEVGAMEHFLKSPSEWC